MSKENVTLDPRLPEDDSVQNSGREAEVSGRLKFLITCWNCGRTFYYNPEATVIYCPSCGSILPNP